MFIDISRLLLASGYNIATDIMTLQWIRNKNKCTYILSTLI